jgi:hypothetical protein
MHASAWHADTAMILTTNCSMLSAIFSSILNLPEVSRPSCLEPIASALMLKRLYCVIRFAPFQPLTQTKGIRDPAENATLHLYHFDCRIVVAHIGRADAVLEQQAPISEIVSLPHDRVHADIGRDTAKNEMGHTKILQ